MIPSAVSSAPVQAPACEDGAAEATPNHLGDPQWLPTTGQTRRQNAPKGCMTAPGTWVAVSAPCAPRAADGFLFGYAAPRTRPPKSGATALPASAAAATPTEDENPASAIAAPGGARRTVISSTKEHQSHGERYQPRAGFDGPQERQRQAHRPHARDVGEAGQGLPGAGEGREEVTALAPEPILVDLDAVEAEISAVFTRHGLAGLNHVTANVRFVNHGGALAGVTVTASAYTRPAGLPSAQPSDCDPFAELAEKLEVAS